MAVFAGAAVAHSALVAPANTETSDSRLRPAPVQLQYVWQEGSVALVTTRVEGMGVVREVGEEQRMTMWAEIVAREEVSRVGPQGDATLTTVWESATFSINGQKASFQPQTARLEKRVGPSGKVYWTREQGWEQAARQGMGAFTIDTGQLALLDLLVHQVQYLRLPAQPVAAGEKWQDMERIETPDVRGYMQEVSELAALGTGPGGGTCTIHSSLTAPLELVLAPDELLLRGKATGKIAHSFDVARGQLRTATGTLTLELRAALPGGLPTPAPVAPPQPLGAAAPAAEGADDAAPAMLQIQLEVRVEREQGVVRAK
jgi:hypothetical protein